MTGTYRICRHEDVERYLAMGWWIVSGLRGSHGDWSMLLKAPVCMEDA
jgi:hypothetical protein